MNINFDTDYILENDRVILQPIKKSDITHLSSFALDEPELWTFSMVSAKGYEGMLKYIENAINGRAEKKEYAFIVFDKEKMQYAGSTRFYDFQPVADTVQLGYTWYGKYFQGTGLNKHCKFLMLQFAFEIIHAKRVEFRADYRNKRSIAAMKSIGCVEEGVLRSNGYCSDGSRRDSIVLSILKQEWENTIKAELTKLLK